MVSSLGNRDLKLSLPVGGHFVGTLTVFNGLSARAARGPTGPSIRHPGRGHRQRQSGPGPTGTEDNLNLTKAEPAARFPTVPVRRDRRRPQHPPRDVRSGPIRVSKVVR